MSVDFIKNRVGASSIEEAQKQHEHICYFIVSTTQKDFNAEYFKKYAERNHSGGDYFLNFVKNVFRKQNYLSFAKYLRHPLPSARLINDRIKTPLSRVFFSDDSFFRYSIKNNQVENPKELDIDNFEQTLFNKLLFCHNDILIHDLKGINEPFREFISIKNVVAIKSKNSTIKELAYKATAKVDESYVDGYVYMNNEKYCFYDKNYNSLIETTHDLGVCPADYIAESPFDDDDVVRKSFFSYVREELEEYVFIKTLLKMTEPNGALPITTRLKTKTTNPGGNDLKGFIDKEPMTSREIGGQRAEYGNEHLNTEHILQAGSDIAIPITPDPTTGKYDMEAIKNFVNFFYLPTEALKYINDRIKQIEQSIIVSLLGDYSEANESAKNEMQVSKSYVSKQDRLRDLAMGMTRIRNLSDFKMLALKYGKENVSVECFYGSDFFIDTQKELYDSFEKAPNAIERKNILVRLSKTRNRFNSKKISRETLMYHLMPFSNDKDFQVYISKKEIDPILFSLQTRFFYWISIFEATYGDISMFWESLENQSEAERLTMINNLLTQIIETNERNIAAPAGV